MPQQCIGKPTGCSSLESLASEVFHIYGVGNKKPGAAAGPKERRGHGLTGGGMARSANL